MSSSKVDLHIHSRFSDRSREWLLRRFDFPDSYSKPRELYRQLKERGMDFVTITDHNSIEGCLEIADLPGTFISEQVTTFFPENRCPVHLLVWGITEASCKNISPPLISRTAWRILFFGSMKNLRASTSKNSCCCFAVLKASTDCATRC
jgi:hypothetical protein